MRLSRASLVAVAGLTLAGCGGGSATVGQPAPPTAALTSQPATTTSVSSGAPTTVTGRATATPTATKSASTRTTTPTTTQTSKPTPKPTKSGPAACAANSQTASLSMQDNPTNPTEPYKFSSSSVTVACGGSISISNGSSADHTFTPKSGGFTDSGQKAPGAKFSVRMSFRGSYGFFCTDHTYMTGTVHVA
jgi:plastocyanin